MDALIARWRGFWYGQREEGQTLTEYALIIGLVAILLVGALGLLNTHLADKYAEIAAIFP